MTENIDYREITPPEDKPPQDYTYNEKRAEIYRLWKEANDPYAEINLTKLSERYGNSVSTIHDDVQIVKQFIKDNLGEEEEIKTDVGFDRSIKKLEKEGKWYKAAKVRKMKWEWLHDTGIKDKEPDKQEITGESGNPLNVTIQRVSEDNIDEFQE